MRDGELLIVPQLGALLLYTELGRLTARPGEMLELTANGKQNIQLPNGEERGFLENGDEVTLRGWCERPGAARIGLGECRDLILG